MLQLDVPSYHIGRHFIPNRSHKVPVTPQFPAPQFLPQFRVPTKQLPCRNTLENLYHVTGTVLGWNYQKHVDVIRHYFERINLQLVAFCNAVEDRLQTLRHGTFKDQLSVLRNPNKVILEVVDCVFPPLDKAHLSDTNYRIRLRRISAFLPAASCGVSSGGPL